ncbi:MAG TPA: fatty acid desaturase family protein [Hyphomicrobiaceae bacterium]|nr:fatty acid desaturase family protein [Hyphomicrobiaceae bacterium]
MPRRIAARELITPDQLAALRSRSLPRSLWMIGHAWAVIIASIALVAWWPNPLTYLIAVVLIGSRQLGLAILMHEGAHGCLSANQALNLGLSQWLCAYPIGAETRTYRHYHLQHHARTQQDDDPDLILSRPFPITKASYRRKFWRDISGQTGFEQRKAQMLLALGDPGWPLPQRLRHFWSRLGPQLIANGILFLLFALAGVWWAYPLLWLLPLLTWFMVVTRIRNIAEHAVVGDADDPLRNTRTTLANWIERALVAPYFVNYHLEHHLFYYIPCYNLPKLHRILAAGPHGGDMEIAPGYLSVLSKATTKPDEEDRPGELVHGGRRQANENSAKAGF